MRRAGIKEHEISSYDIIIYTDVSSSTKIRCGHDFMGMSQMVRVNREIGVEFKSKVRTEVRELAFKLSHG